MYDGSLDENFFQNPKNLWNNFRKIILGPKVPKNYVQWFYWINTIICTLFLGWHILGFLAVSFRSIIFEKKKIAVDEIITEYAKNSAFTVKEFILSLQLHHALSSFIWIILLFVMVLFWRRKRWIFIYALFALLVYFLQGIFIFGWRFITQELTLFDWISLCVFISLITIDAGFNLYLNKESEKENV